MSLRKLYAYRMVYPYPNWSGFDCKFLYSRFNVELMTPHVAFGNMVKTSIEHLLEKRYTMGERIVKYYGTFLFGKPSNSRKV